MKELFVIKNLNGTKHFCLPQKHQEGKSLCQSNHSYDVLLIHSQKNV